jgi:hypothetical protein
MVSEVAVADCGEPKSSSYNHPNSHYCSNNHKLTCHPRDDHYTTRNPQTPRSAKSHHQEYEGEEIDHHNNKDGNDHPDDEDDNKRRNDKDNIECHENKDQHKYAENSHAFKELKTNEDDKPIVKFRGTDSKKCHPL